MPGPPAEFTDNTIIIITGNSGIGKSTLASFLSHNREDIKYLATDSFFNPKIIKKYKSEKYKKLLEVLNEINKPTDNVSRLSRIIDKDIFTKLVIKIIRKYYKKGYKCIILEGYIIKYIYSNLLYYIKKKHIRIWNITNESEYI